MGMFDDLFEKFTEIEDGNYVVKIEGFTREKTKNNVWPIRWQLKAVDEVKGVLPTKFNHVESDVGFRILLNELKQLGFQKPKTPKELESILHSLIGALVEVEIFTTDQEADYRVVRFVRRVY